MTGANPLNDENEIMKTNFCNVAREGHVVIVTLSRPEVMNALHKAADDELDVIWDEFAVDPDQWVAIVTGSGDRAFCAGNDLKFQASVGGPRQYPKSGFGGLTARFDLDKPVIAAVNGVCMGGGCELALACDIVIAAENARFALPEPRVGMAALAGGLHRLPRTIGLKRAMGMLLTGRHVGAREAFDLGFVTALAPEGQALDTAKAWALQLLECSPMSLRATKQVAMRGLAFADLQDACRAEYDAVTKLRNSKDYIEGAKAFFEKRKPVWSIE